MEKHQSGEFNEDIAPKSAENFVSNPERVS